MRAFAIPLILLPLLLCACGGGDSTEPAAQPTPTGGGESDAAQVAIGASAPAVTLSQGGQVDVELALQRTGGASATVQLSIDATELPAGVKAEFSADVLAGAAVTSVLTLKAAASAVAPSSAHVHVHARSVGVAGNDLDLLVTVVATAPSASDPARPFDVPAGTPVTLPSGVRIAGPILGMHADLQPGDDLSDQPCLDKTAVNDASRFVAVCITLVNSGNAPVTLTFPPGTTFVADSDQTQTGAVAHLTSFVVPVGTRQVMLRLYCGNGTRHSSKPGDTYVLGPMSNAPRAIDMVHLLADRQPTDDAQRNIIQGMVWLVGDTTGLSDTQVHQALLQSTAGVPLRP